MTSTACIFWMELFGPLGEFLAGEARSFVFCFHPADVQAGLNLIRTLS